MMTGPRLFKLKSADATETSIRLGPELDFALIHKGLGVAAEFTPEEALMFALRLADMAFERKVDVARAEAMYAELLAREETMGRLRWLAERAGVAGHG